MKMCPFCGKIYDESKYNHCPYCSGELDHNMDKVKTKDCPECGGIMYWYGCWECSNCDCIIDSDEEDYDTILE